MDNQVGFWVHTNWNGLKPNETILSQDFKKWIEQTDLFFHIKKFAGTGLIIEALPVGLQLQLDKVVKIEKAEDLPIELIQNFYENSPFYTDNSYTQKQVNLNNESSDNESLW